MDILDSVKTLVEEGSASGDHAAVTSGLLQELGGLGGIAGLIQSLQQNGAGGLVQQWANGQTQPANANEIEQGLGGSGLIESIAQRTGVSADTVRSALTTIVPLLVNHVTSSGHVTTEGQTTDSPAPDAGSLLQSVLGKISQ